jgi:TonB family protein
MKREFPFWWSFFIAILIHTLLGFVLKRNPLLLAATPPIVRPAPLQMHFVESPPSAKTVAAPPKTPYLSDANRKAGPLVASPKRELKTTEYAKGILRQGRPNSPPSAPPGRAPTVSPPGASQQSTPLPKIEETPSESSGPADIHMGSSQGDPKKLSQSLQNLDQFIGSGSGQSSGGGESGDLPSGDTGSGVFFDTQGFDLGPWANRVVAIVRSNWIIPVAAELGVKGIVGVAFKVEKSTGRIIDIEIVRTSEIPSFDQAAANALKSSSPLPPLPPDFPRPLLPGVFRFYYNTPIPQANTQAPPNH